MSAAVSSTEADAVAIAVAAEREACAQAVERLAEAVEMAGGLASPKSPRLREAVALIRRRAEKLDAVEPKPAEFFGGEDDEVFTADDPEQYLADTLGDAEHLPEALDVVRYRPRAVTAKWIRDAAETLTESLEERFGEEYGGDDCCWRLGGEAAAQPLMLAAVSRIVAAHLRVWQCEEVDRRTYTRAELEALLKDWGIEAPPPAPTQVPVMKFTKGAP